MQIIDWNEPQRNDFFLASQLWVSGEMYRRRADLVGFVNGLPLLFIELKASHRKLKEAFDKNLRDYKDTIPHLFWYNAFLILSNGSQSRLGTLTSPWEHFSEWKKINSEGEEGVVSLETMIRGTCHKRRFLDLIENFMLFQEASGGLRKLVARNHQVLGVNQAFEAVRQLKSKQGRLGVFWHTQGSGKSYSMVFFSQKVLRRLHGNWSFLIVTDRSDLDKQIYKNFADVGAVQENEERIRAQSGLHLRHLLQEDHRYLFTLIQKFHTAPGVPYPLLSERADIIVMTDEAHRSQYDIFAANMRRALPKAAFIGFTGTPLITGEEQTRQVFGDYISIYNFTQSIADGATVPLYYENRIPELQLTNQQLNEDIAQLLEESELDQQQEQKVEREFTREYHLISREERLNKIGADIVSHFLGRGYQGKAMVVAINKMTAVRLYNKVQEAWQHEISRLKAELKEPSLTTSMQQQLQNKLRYMEQSDMAVVISPSQNEIDDFRQKGLDIRPHRQRMISEALESKFKEPSDPFRLVFVCAMWMTGFDVPNCSTIYLDKPMRKHTLMQTIARANRVFGNKHNGLIVDYIGVFRHLQEALAIYGAARGDKQADLPIKDKQALIEELQDAIAETRTFCQQQHINLEGILKTSGFERFKRRDEAIEAILFSSKSKQRFLTHASQVERLFKAILPDPSADNFSPMRQLLLRLTQQLHALTPAVNISPIMEAVESLLDQSVAADAYLIREQANQEIIGDYQPTAQQIDLSQINFAVLHKQFAQGLKRTAVETLRGQLQQQLKQMIRLNKGRLNYQERFQHLIDHYNAGATQLDELFQQLTTFARQVEEEQQRHSSEQLSEEELALFDLLSSPQLKLERSEKVELKQISQALLQSLKSKQLVLDWRKRGQARAAVKLTIEHSLDRLPESYTQELYEQTCTHVYEHIYDCYYGANRSLYD